jgi:hypothetical protein
MKDIMLDLETWGTRPGCALRSIGAVMFDPTSEILGEKFYVNIDRASCEHSGLHVSRDTEAWWEKQSATARDALLVNPRPLGEAVGTFTRFFNLNGAARVWSQGANFDEPLLSAVYDLLKVRAPWKFWDSRCTRTIYAAAGLNFNREARASGGTHHNALDDAVHQARCVQKSYRMLGLHSAAPSAKEK